MAEALKRWQKSQEGAKWQQDRARLPVLSIKQDLLSQLLQHDVVVVSGDTGCGKTTQVCLTYGCKAHGQPYLPVLSIKQDLLTQLQQHDVVVVSGDTGCGKTTQVCPADGCKAHGQPYLVVLSIKQDLLRQLQQHVVIVVSGDTGCGKTTKVCPRGAEHLRTNPTKGGLHMARFGQVETHIKSWPDLLVLSTKQDLLTQLQQHDMQVARGDTGCG